MRETFQIAIDGPAGSGKTTVSNIIANHYNIYYLSSGKIFRSYALALKDIDPKDEQLVKSELTKINIEFKDGRFYNNNLDITNNLTSDILSLPASIISAYPFTREKYLKDIKKICKSNSIVVDGRDIGTVVMPKAKFKFYLDAAPEIRTERRAKEINCSTDPRSKEFKQLLEQIMLRDKQDKTRKIAPLKQAKDAIYINSDNMTAQEVANYIINYIDTYRKVR